MAVSAPATTPNDSGIVLILFFMMAALTHAVVSAVSLYAAATHTRVRLLSGWANVGNACVHAFLILLLIVDQEELGKVLPDASPIGPAVLAAINAGVGLRTLANSDAGAYWAFGWNTFVVFLGCLIPMVWQAFINEGLASWPYLVILLWFGIFFAELTAFVTSALWFALGKPKAE